MKHDKGQVTGLKSSPRKKYFFGFLMPFTVPSYCTVMGETMQPGESEERDLPGIVLKGEWELGSSVCL